MGRTQMNPDEEQAVGGKAARLVALPRRNRNDVEMTYDPARHHRRSIRLPAYDYAQAGAYFVTICTQNRDLMFGEVVKGQMILNGPGQMIESVWRESPQHYPGVEIDTFVLMPNHLRGVIILVGAGPRACPDNPGQPPGVAPTGTMSLPDVVHRFKSLTTARYRRQILHGRCLPLPGRLWQRNYYERIIRDDAEFHRVRRYIIDNPAHWEEDPENPSVVGTHGRASLHSDRQQRGGALP